MAVSALLQGCRAQTEYVPRTPGRATLGMERREVRIYKDGVLAHAGDAARVLACSQPAAVAANAAAAHESSARVYAGVASAGWGLTVLFFPVAVVGASFGALAESEHDQSFAFAVDAVNQHNDAATCIRTPRPAPPLPPSAPSADPGAPQ